MPKEVKRYEAGRVMGGYSLHEKYDPSKCRGTSCPEPRVVDCCGLYKEIDIVECPQCGKQWTQSCNFDDDFS